MRLFTQAKKNATFPIDWSQQGSLCRAWPVFTSVNGSFYVARRPSDASGLSVIAILLTVQGVLPVCGMLRFLVFSRTRSCSQLPAVMGNRLFFFSFVCSWRDTLICLCLWVGACLCVSEEHPRWLFFSFFLVNIRVIVSSDWLTVSSIDTVHVQLLQLFLAVTECLQCWTSCISALSKQQKVMEDNGNISSYTWIVSFLRIDRLCWSDLLNLCWLDE